MTNKPQGETAEHFWMRLARSGQYDHPNSVWTKIVEKRDHSKIAEGVRLGLEAAAKITDMRDFPATSEMIRALDADKIAREVKP
jgi:hypothetical protein